MDCDNYALTAICRSELLIPLSSKPCGAVSLVAHFFTLLIFQEQILKPTILLLLLSYILLKDTIGIKSCQSQIFSAVFFEFLLVSWNTEWMMNIH